MKNYSELARLILKAVTAFDPAVAALQHCSSELPHDYDLTVTRRVYAELATEFNLNPNGMADLVAGEVYATPIECLVHAWGVKHSLFVDRVWVQGGAIVLRNYPTDHPLYAELRKLTTQEVCDRWEMERRQDAFTTA